MSWNEPGGDKKDPWSGQGNSSPPDLDEAIRNLQEKFSKFFGGGSGGNSPMGEFPNKNTFLLGAAVIALLWLASGFYIVDEGNNGVETRFGEYIATTQSGLNWHFPAPIEHVDIVNVKQQRYIEIGYRSAGAEQLTGSVPKEALMLTKDENYVDVRLAVQYQVKDAKDFLFNLPNPSETLKQVTESAQRGVIGSNVMDFVLTEGRSEIVAQIKKDIQEIMDGYQSGVQIISVNLQDVQPPEQVQNAFADAIKAREDQQRLINEAQAYANDVVPKARGGGARLLQEAEGYKEQAIAQAIGETSRFSKLYTEYKKAPEITRKRLYIESIESVLAETDTLLVDVKGGNNMMYLPLDKIIQNRTMKTTPKTSGNNLPTTEQASNQLQPSLATEEQLADRATGRGREARGR